MPTQTFEYKVVPAPRRGEKARGAKTTVDRFAVALTRVMNEQARDGWEYIRADTLPCDERSGLTGTATHFQHLLVFRRALAAGAKPAVSAYSDEPVLRRPAAPEPEFDEAEDEAETVVTPLSPRIPEGSAPALGPAVPPLPSTRPNGRI